MPSPNDQAGRIDNQAFVVSSHEICLKSANLTVQVSTAVLFGLGTLSTASRLYIRLRLQKQLSIDEGLLIIALCCLTCALSIVYTTTVDKMYLMEALTINLPSVHIPSDVTQEAYSFRKWVPVTLTLAWCAIMAVKFSFLFLLRKLIDRIWPLIIYWWIVTVFNVAVLGYGISAYYVSCPYHFDPGSRKSINSSLRG